MKTITIQIGNSDNKLSQINWANFTKDTHQLLSELVHQIHFTGFSEGFSAWQNAAFVAEIDEKNERELKF